MAKPASKPPSFPFYGQDFQTGTMAFTPAERGVYVDCLWHQWSSGGVPADDLRRLAQVMRCTPAEAKKHWVALAPKFVKGDDGLYRNARLEVVRAEKQAWHESRRTNGGKGGRPPKQQRSTEPSGSEDENLVVPYSLSSSSEPTVQSDAREAAPVVAVVETRERKRYGDPHGFRVDPNAAALIAIGDGRAVSIPEGWAGKARREYGLGFEDIDAFASWCKGYVQRHGFEDGGKRLAWLDARLAEFRAERKARRSSDDDAQRTRDFLREQDAILDANRQIDPETLSRALREGFERGKGRAS